MSILYVSGQTMFTLHQNTKFITTTSEITGTIGDILRVYGHKDNHLILIKDKLPEIKDLSILYYYEVKPKQFFVNSYDLRFNLKELETN